MRRALNWFVVLLSILFLHEKISIREGAGIVLALAAGFLLAG